jgi:chaperonin GroES
MLKPVEYKIVVELDEIDERTAGGIYIPVTLVDKQKMTQVEAVLISAGGNAFEDWKGTIPKPGDHVYVAKMAGYEIKDADGKKFRLMNDKDIVAVIEE